ncbi:uncharacterized protein LOC141632899 [Silene latifolia]|uniref:uncharacterized protein LOC141632899 n=1 Tax=Silene latifolia TaxID=37657 RepID=UPI003D781DFA
MCMEILSAQLRKAETQRQIHGLKISRYAPTLSHLFYANDAFICFKATPSSFESLRDIFQDFEAASGQMINLTKSFIKFSPNSPADFKTHLNSILRMKDSPSFGTYLGVPVDLLKQNKLIIINSILLGSIAHILAAIPLPLAILRKIDSLIAAFWWSKDTSRRSIHWLSQQYIHAPRDSGGMGICRAVDSCKPALAWKIGNGASFDLLSAPWVQGRKPVLKQPQPQFAPPISALLLDNGTWNPSSIFNLFMQSTAKEILAMEPLLLTSDDYLYWKYTEDGNYTIKSGYVYRASQNSSRVSVNRSFPWKTI